MSIGSKTARLGVPNCGEDFSSPLFSFLHPRNSLRQFQCIYTSPSISDEDERNIIEDWDEFKPFCRIEIALNEEQIQDFLSKYTHPYGNDNPLLSLIDNDEFKRSILLYVVDNHIEPNKTDFDIRVEEV